MLLPATTTQANPLVYFDIALGRYGDATPLGRVVMELKVRVSLVAAACGSSSTSAHATPVITGRRGAQDG